MQSSPIIWKDGRIMPPLDGDLPHHDAQRYMLKFTGGSVDHEFVLAGDYDSLLRELARCQARIGELEVQVQQWKERAKVNEATDDPLGLFVCPHCYAVTPTVIQEGK